MSHVMPPMPSYPAQPVYAHFYPPSRPGLVTTLGVLAIVISILAAVVNFAQAIVGLGTMVTAQQEVRQMAAASGPIAPLAQSNEVAAPDGFDSEQTLAVVNGLHQVRPMNAERAEQVRLLASKYGKRMFSFDPSGITASRVRASVSSSGPMLIRPGENGDYFVLAAGRLQVSDSQASFTPDGGLTLRSNDQLTDRSLTEPQIDQLVQRVNGNLPQPLNDAQQRALRDIFRDPKQMVIDPAEPDWAVIHAAGANEDGGAWILFSGAQVRLAANGTPALLSPMAPLPGRSVMTGKPIRTQWFGYVIFEAIVSGLLCVALLVGGILLLRGRPSGPKVLTIWSWTKLPVAVLAGVFGGLAVQTWHDVFGEPGLGGYVPALIGVGFAVICLIFPLVTLAVLRRSDVRAYFRGVM